MLPAHVRSSLPIGQAGPDSIGQWLCVSTNVIDAHDPRALGRFWAAVLDEKILFEADDKVIVGSDESHYPGLCFVPVPDVKSVKNRLHIDLDPDDRDAEVERIIALGGRPVDVGQGSDVTRVVLADPEGNEFCVLRPHRSLVD